MMQKPGSRGRSSAPRQAREFHRQIRQTDGQAGALSVWEITIKRTAGRLGFRRAVTAHGFALLPITGEHAEHAGNLPRHHRDPFDRMPVAQATLERMVLGRPDPSSLSDWSLADRRMERRLASRQSASGC
jgi:PIN domain nuclease of toxin-antitoxin system